MGHPRRDVDPVKAFALALLLMAASATPAAGATYSLTPNVAAPVYGSWLSYTAVVPPEAARQSRQPQYHDQPSFQTDCYQDNVRVWSGNTSTVSRKRADGAVTVVSGYVILGGTANGWTWTSGAARCYGTVYYFDVQNQLHTVATTVFEVGA